MKKYMIGICVMAVAVITFITVLPLQAFFSGDEEVQKLSGKDAVEINIALPLAHEEKISSLQLSLTVTDQDGNPADTKLLKQVKTVTFLPEKSVASDAEIVEQRYHEDTGILDIYVAGTTPLFPEEGQLMLGSVTAELENGSDAYVKVTDESFKVVKGITLETMTDEQDAEVHIRAAGVQSPDVSEEPDVSQQPVVSQEPDVSQQPDVSQEPVVSQQPVVSQEPTVTEGPVCELPGTGNSINDDSKLKSALEVAATYLESDYTADSYALLKKAVENAVAVLNNPNSTQEDIDKAKDAIYNAIGTLVRLDKNNSNQQAATATPIPAGSAANTASTKDDNSLLLYAVMAVMSLAVIAGVSYKKKQHTFMK